MSDKDIIKEAKEVFAEFAEQEAEQRARFSEDLKFAAGEQWPDKVRQARENDPYGARPCLTMDKTGQYRRQVINDARQNKPAIKVRPCDDKADIDVAEILQGVVRHIEDVSRADIADDNALDNAVTCGLGWIRIYTELTNPAKNEQEIRYGRVHNIFSVYCGTDWTEPDGSDIERLFVVEDMPRKRFERMFPKLDVKSWDVDGQWCGKDTMKLAEYYRLTEESENVLLLDTDEVLTEEQYWSLYEGDETRPKVIGNRENKVNRCEWFKLTSEEIVDRTIVPCSFVPVIPVIGNEMWVDGKRQLTGMIRWVMDAQRAYNYARSSYVENVALAPKAPYIAAAGQVEDFSNEWSTANSRNVSVLRYNPVDINGSPVPPPQRQMPPPVSSGWAQEMQMAERDIQAALGMYAASIGAEGQEKSGRAILARQKEGDTSTFHYIDNLSRTKRQAGRIIVEMIPAIYDTRRVTRIVGEDGELSQAVLDPQLRKPMAQIEDEKGETRKIYNPTVGTYDVSISVGPSYNTKRAEAADAMVELTRANPQIMPLVGDLMVRAMDWPMADDIAERLKYMLPPEIKQKEQEDDGPEAEVQAAVMQVKQQYEEQAGQAIQAIQMLQQQLAQAQQAIEQANQETALKAAELQLKQREISVSEYEAETERIQTVTEAQAKAMTPDKDDAAEMQQFAALQQMLAQLAQKVDSMCQMPAQPPQSFHFVIEKGGTVRKEMAIQAPSGEMYQGIVTESED